MKPEQITLITDSREQTPLVFKNMKSEVDGLYAGDYSYVGAEHLFSVERKSIADLVGSVTSGRERFERELVRLRGYRFKRLLVVGLMSDIEKGNYRSSAKPRSVLNTLSAFEVRYDIPVIFADDEIEAALIVERFAFWHARETEKNAAAFL